MQIVVKKIESGAKREGQSGFRKQDIFVFGLKVPMTKIYIPVPLFQRSRYCFKDHNAENRMQKFQVLPEI